MSPIRLEPAGALFLAVALTAACASPAASPGASAPGGGAPAALRLLDLEGRPVDPLEASTKPAVCLLLVRVDCPISNRYAPEVRRLAGVFEETADFRLVYSDADETAEAIRAHVADYDYDIPALRDPEQRLRALTGARVTPEVAVFAGDGNLVYVGRIDDRYVDFGKARPEARTRDLEQVLTELAAGRSPAFRRTTAVGCPFAEPAR